MAYQGRSKNDACRCDRARARRLPRAIPGAALCGFGHVHRLARRRQPAGRSSRSRWPRARRRSTSSRPPTLRPTTSRSSCSIPAVAHVAHGDTLTSPEEIHYSNSALTPGHLEGAGLSVHRWAGDGSGHVPRHVGDLPAGRPSAFRPPFPAATSAAPRHPAHRRQPDLQLRRPSSTRSGPRESRLNFWDTAGNYWESGPWGTTTQNSFVHRSTDGGLEFHVDSPNGLRPDPGPGGGDTDVVVDDQGYDYFVDLESLVNLGTSVSNDNGNNWRKNPAAVPNTAVDRPVVRRGQREDERRHRTTPSFSPST